MLRLVLAALLLAVTAAPAVARADDAAYTRANARLAKTVPHYPRARVLVAERVRGEVGPTGYEAVQRIYALSRASTQRSMLRFYSRKLGPTWRRRGTACFLSRSRLVVVLVSANGRRLGVLIDSRGGRRCAEMTGLIGDLLDVGYPTGPLVRVAR